MGSLLIGFVVGVALGAATGTELGAFGFGMFGMLVGGSVFGVRWIRAHLGDAPVTERHRAMCTSFGHAAELELVGDTGLRRWYDVRSCSLLPVATQVDCDKGCVRMLNLAGVRPGAPCGCESRDDAAA